MTPHKNISTQECHRELSKFKCMFEKAQEGIAIIQDGYIRFCNPWFCRLSGYTEEEVTSLHIASFIHPDDRARILAYHTGRPAGMDIPEHYEFKGITKSGSVLWVEVSGTLIDWEGRAASLNFFVDISMRKRALKDARLSRERLRELVEHLGIGVAIYKAVDSGDDFIFLDFNKAAEEITRVSRDTVIGKRLSHCFPRMKDLGFLAMLKHVWESGESIHLPPFYYEDTIRQGWRENRLYRIPSGEVVALFEDVTEKKEAESALRTSEQQKDLILNTTSEQVTYCDPDLNIIWANQSAVRLLGKSSEELIGLSCHQLRHQRDEPCEGCPIVEAIKTKTEQEAEVHDAEGRDWLLRGYPVLNDQGDVVGLVVYIRDITEAKQAEHRLENVQKRIKFHVENSPLGFIEWAGGDRISSWSSRAEAIFGWKEADVLGKNWRDLHLVVEEDLSAVEKQMGQLFSGTENYNTIRNQNYSHDGSVLHCIWCNSVLRDESGQIISMLSLVEDITEQVQAEAENVRLEEQFHQAQKLESVGRLAGGVAHDLNNLLSPILGYGEMLLRDMVGGDPRKNGLEQIVQAGMRARDLVRQLLAFSRKQTLESKPIDLNALITNFEKLLRRTIREDVAMHVVLDPSIPHIKGDIGQLEQVVMNLVVNAQDAMPDGGELTIETVRAEVDEHFVMQHRGAIPGSYVMLTVRDTGCGMDENVCKHVFEPFFTTKEKEKGTGLGLATVYGIIKQHGGNIYFHSAPGQGAVFEIYLPVMIDSEPLKEDSCLPEIALKGSETILLLEDSKQVRDLVLAILEGEGYVVLVAEKGTQALEILRTYDGPVHMLLTDVVMPEMNGKQFVTQAMVSHPQIRVLYMSGYMDDEVLAHHGILDTDVSFIQKPFTVQALTSKVREILDT